MINPYNIRQIRILPMDRKEEFKTEEDARKFLTVDLVQRGGKYYYRERGMNIKSSYALILFQYSTSIIGYGILTDVIKDVIIDMVDGKPIQYNGYFQFFTMSIHNIINISLNEIQQIDNNITHLSNPKWHIGIEHYDQIYELLLQKQIEFEQYYL